MRKFLTKEGEMNSFHQRNEFISPIYKQKTPCLVLGVGVKRDWSLKVNVVTEFFIDFFLFQIRGN